MPDNEIKPDTYDLSQGIDITEINLTVCAYAKDGQKLLDLEDKPEVLKNKEIRLRYPDNRDWSSSKPEAFFAKAGVFSEREFKTPEWNVLAQDGWSFKTLSDPDGNRTSKSYYVRIENKNSNQVYIGVPVTKNHFSAGTDPVLDDLLIIDEQSFLDNPNFAMSLNHQKISVENENGHWTVAKDDPLAGIIKLPGNTIEANNPEEIYLLTEAELEQYNSRGARKGWSEDKSKKTNGLRLFVKKEYKNGAISTLDKRYAKKIMIPQVVNGEETFVKHFLLSDQKTLESLEIMAPRAKEEESILQENVDDARPEVELSADEVARATNPTAVTYNQNEQKLASQDEDVDLGEAEPQDFPSGPTNFADLSGVEDIFAPEVHSVSESKKVEYAGMAKELADRVASINGGTLSVKEKAFLDNLNLIQGDPQKVNAALASIQNSPQHQNIIKQYTKSGGKDKSVSEKQNISENPGVAKMQKASESKKVEYTGMAKELADRIASMNGGTLSAIEKAFLDNLNLIQSDPQKVNEALASIQNSPEHQNIIKQFMINGNADGQNVDDKNAPKDNHSGPKTSPSPTTVSGAEAAFGAAAGLTAGLVKGVGSVAGSVVTGSVALGGAIVKGTLGEINNIINNHHKRKQYRLEHPEVVEQERTSKKERLMATRQAVAEDSNRILDAKIESVLVSKQYIDQNPAVQQMYDMIDSDPSQKKNLMGWLEDTADGNPVFAEHLKNVMENAGGVARSMEENLKANNLADGDLKARKDVFENFNEKFAHDSLADVLPDAGDRASDGEQQASIRESITKAINTVMKMLKDMMLVLLGKKKKGQSESVDLGSDTAPAMSR